MQVLSGKELFIHLHTANTTKNLFININRPLIKSYPCTYKKPVSCEQCKAVYWSYNLFEQYRLTHASINCI